MTEELMVGTVGWDYDDWIDGYYPDDMPQDWRFGYYSNDFRSVLVPGDHFAGGDLSMTREWLEDCDASFRFVVEIPADLLPDARREPLTDFLDGLEGLDGRAVGYYIDLRAEDVDKIGLNNLLQLVASRGPLCVNVPSTGAGGAELDNVLSRFQVGRCWSPDESSAPATGGRLMLALTDTQDPKNQRHIVETLEDWMKQTGGIAGVFFHGGVSATKAASQTRIIAEMLGV
jgi:hypothetical protein